MKKIDLTDRQRQILQSLRERLSEDKSRYVASLLDGNTELSEIDALCRIIDDEYLMAGIEENYEPNDYGRELGILLNAVNMPRLLS